MGALKQRRPIPCGTQPLHSIVVVDSEVEEFFRCVRYICEWAAEKPQIFPARWIDAWRLRFQALNDIWSSEGQFAIAATTNTHASAMALFIRQGILPREYLSVGELNFKSKVVELRTKISGDFSYFTLVQGTLLDSICQFN